ncbi:MAG: PA14 domain-containing protein, partial [Chitinophagaceae bacterium]
ISVRNAGVNDYFGFLWEGFITIPTTGNYTFELISDDGSKLYFNTPYSVGAAALVNNDGIHGAYPISNQLNIQAGLYPIAMTFFEKYSGESMQVYWSGPGIPRQLIPNAAFTESYSTPADNIAPSAPLNVKAILTGNGFMEIGWDNSSDNVGVTGYDIYVNNVKKYTSIQPTTRIDTTANTSYSITIKARDLAGNTSDFSSPLAVTTSPKANGLKYRYYEGVWNNLPDFNALIPKKTGSTPNIDMSVRTPGRNDFFGFVWEGYINIPTAGNYTFELISDDGSKLYFNSFYSASATALVNHDGLHSAYPVSATVNVAAAGLYPFAMTFFENSGGETMQVYWSGPGIPRQLLTTSSMSAGSGLVANMSTDLAPAITARSQVASASAEAGFHLMKAFPNPFSDRFSIQFNNTLSGGNASVGIYDLSGKMVFRQHFGNIASGNAQLLVQINGNRLVPATYIVRLHVNEVPLKTWILQKDDK